MIGTPLFSLMRDQVEEARRIDVTTVSFNSTTSAVAWQANMWAIEKDKVDAVPIAPERFADRSFMDGVLKPIV